MVLAYSNSIEEAKSRLEKRDNFKLCVALQTSIADIKVFSNNPSLDLHLIYHGKKNHEGLHFLGGLISSSTVLYRLVWATELSLAATGLIFPALVLGYNFFIAESMTYQFLYRLKNLYDYHWQQLF